jgi:dolichol-phosphate mannosyltransferase
MENVKTNNPATPKTLIILPTYNEKENIEAIAAAIFEQLPGANILIIDDGSPDGTGVIADAMAASDGRVRALHRPSKMGLGTAYIFGFAQALEWGYDYIFEMDSDFSHDPKYLPQMVKALDTADLVLGSRYVTGGGTENWGLMRRFISKGGNVYANMILHTKIRDLTGGFKGFRASTIRAVDFTSIQAKGYAFQIETTYRVLRKVLTVVEVPIVFVDRRLGQSKMNKGIFMEALFGVIRMRLRKR